MWKSKMVWWYEWGGMIWGLIWMIWTKSTPIPWDCLSRSKSPLGISALTNIISHTHRWHIRRYRGGVSRPLFRDRSSSPSHHATGCTSFATSCSSVQKKWAWRTSSVSSILTPSTPVWAKRATKYRCSYCNRSQTLNNVKQISISSKIDESVKQ